MYLYVLDMVCNVVLFHATQPDLLEFQPLVGIARDGRTGELILPQVLAAAKSGSEGGFVEYYYDDPADDADDADMPKVGHAREFSGQLPRPDGSAVPIRFIVGSGFYASGQQAEFTGRDAVVESVLPQVMRTITAGTVDAISGRVRQASPGGTPDRKAMPLCTATSGQSLIGQRRATARTRAQPRRPDCRSRLNRGPATTETDI